MEDAVNTALEDAKVADTDAAVYKQIWEYSDNAEIFEIVLRKERNTMNTVLKCLGALVLAAILIAGMVPAMETRAASAAPPKPGNCRFVRWREKGECHSSRLMCYNSSVHAIQGALCNV